MMRKDSEPKRISFGEIAKELNRGLESADPMRLAGLKQLGRMHAIKSAGLQREQARLAQKLGAGHARVAALDRKLETNRELERDLALGVSRAQTPATQPDTQAWTLHGHVRDQARSGVPDVTVALYDEKGQWIEDLGHACTDNDGYFRLSARPQAADAVKTATNAKELQNVARSAAGANAAGRAAYIHVSYGRTTLYADTSALAPKLGEVVYREIILEGDACECAPPYGKQSTPGGKPDQSKEARYLGNRKTHELHDLTNAKLGCQIGKIQVSQRESFTSQKKALAAGYDFCAYCFGKENSKR